MRKKSVGKLLKNSLCVGLAAIMVTGCGTAKAEEIPEVSADTGASVEEEAAPSKEASVSNLKTTEVKEHPLFTENYTVGSENKDNAALDEPVVVKPHTLEYESDNKVEIGYADYYLPAHIFSVDTDGKIIGKYSISDIAEILDEHDTFYRPVTFLLEKEGILYYECRQEYAYPSWSQDAVFAIDPVNGEIAKVIETEHWFEKFDYYDGSFYLEHRDPSGDNVEICKIDKVADKLSYSVGESQPLDKYRKRTYNAKECYERILGENGYIILKKETGDYVHDLNGNETRVGAYCAGTAVLLTYGPQFVFFATQESTYNITGVYMYDVENERTIKLPISTTDLAYDMVYQNGILYYSTIDSEELGTYTLYSYNVETGDIQILYKDQTGGFSRSYGPLSSDIIENGKIFMREVKDKVVSWYYADLKDVEGTRTLLDFEAILATIPPKEDPIAKYGKVETIKGEARCPHCNQVYYSVAADAFVLDPAYSKQADKINAVLMERAKQRTAMNNSQNEYTKEQCQSMHGSAMYTFSDDYTVSEVHIVNGRYLAVSEIVEYRSTDAPSDWENRQFLFDLQTGNELNIMSFYPGTEDDLKKLLANKVVEHFRERYGEVSKPFSAELAETTYNDAYKNVALDAIFFNEDGIMCYFINNGFIKGVEGYSPYETDYFRVRVSYQELLGRPTLSK